MQVLFLYRLRKSKPRLKSELRKQQHNVTLFACNHFAHVIVIWQMQKLLCYCTDFALFYFEWGQFPSTNPLGLLFGEAILFRGFFALRVWGTYIWRGSYIEGLIIFGILRYIISLLIFAQRLKKRRITYVELEITFFDCLRTLHFELIFAFVVQVSQVKIIFRLIFFNQGWFSISFVFLGSPNSWIISTQNVHPNRHFIVSIIQPVFPCIEVEFKALPWLFSLMSFIGFHTRDQTREVHRTILLLNVKEYLNRE